MKTDNTCPFLQPNPHTSDGRYTQPTNVVMNLTLYTINTQVHINNISCFHNMNP